MNNMKNGPAGQSNDEYDKPKKNFGRLLIDIDDPKDEQNLYF